MLLLLYIFHISSVVELKATSLEFPGQLQSRNWPTLDLHTNSRLLQDGYQVPLDSIAVDQDLKGGSWATVRGSLFISMFILFLIY